MNKADAGLRKMVHGHLTKALGWYWTPIETGTTHAGVPDSHWAHEPTRTDGWIEHKATRGWAVVVRPHQHAWIEQRIRCGVRCVFLVRAAGGGGDGLWVVGGAFSRQLAADGLRGLPAEAVLARWDHQWDWAGLGEVLTRDRLR